MALNQVYDFVFFHDQNKLEEVNKFFEKFPGEQYVIEQINKNYHLIRSPDNFITFEKWYPLYSDISSEMYKDVVCRFGKEQFLQMKKVRKELDELTQKTNKLILENFDQFKN